MQAMVTTTDNPFDPFIQFDEWRSFDEGKGYFTCEYLARIAVVSDALSPDEYNNAILNAVEEIVAMNLLGIYKKVLQE